MCYYSAETVANRKARLHETVGIGRLNEHAVGLVDPDDHQLAVCLEPGTRMVIEGIPPSRQREWGVGHEAAAVFKAVPVGETGEMDAIVLNGREDKAIDFQSCVVGMKFFIDFVPPEAGSTPIGARSAERIPQYA